MKCSTKKNMISTENRFLFNAAMMTHIYKYIDKGLEDVNDKTTMPDIVYRIKQQAYNFVAINRFSSEDVKKLKDIETEEFIDKMSGELSFLMFGLHLVKLYTERTPNDVKIKMNISEKKLKLGTAPFVVPMLKLKKADKELYDEYKKLIDESKETAEYFYEFMYKNLLTGDEDGLDELDRINDSDDRVYHSSRDVPDTEKTEPAEEGNEKTA